MLCPRLTLTLSFILFLSTRTQVTGYIQEISLHESLNGTGDVFTFRSHVPSIIPFGMDKIVQICMKGLWNLYNAENYEYWGGIEYSENSTISCFPTEYFRRVSFRHGGSIDTNVDSISLYNFDFYERNETLLTEGSYSFPESINVKSLVATGPTGWTIFEGRNFTGTNFCTNEVLQEHPQREVAAVYDVTAVWHLASIGSVRKGC